MKARLAIWWENLHSSYWFLPGVFLILGGALALGLTAWDEKIENDSLTGLAWIYSGGPDGARSVLSAIATSVLAVTGTTFSITIAVLSLTSSQFGPRLLRNFMKDVSNQIVLGTFIGTFLYCLLVLRTVRSIEEAAFVPHVAVTVGVGLAVASVCMLVYFIHHTILSIQASQLIAQVSKDLMESIARLFSGETALPGRGGAADGNDRVLPELTKSATIAAEDSGYIQAVDYARLYTLAEKADAIILQRRAPGQFVPLGAALADLWPPESYSARLAAEVNAAYSLGSQGTPTQDISFSLRQLTEIGIRALSPGINDPGTAIICLDHIGAGLCKLVRCHFPAAHRYDRQGRLRLVLLPPVFSELLEVAFAQIRRYGERDPDVLCRLLEVLADIGECAGEDTQRGALGHQARLVRQTAQSAVLVDDDRQQVERQYRVTMQILGSDQ